MKKLSLVLLAIFVSLAMASSALAADAKMKTTTMKAWVSDSKCGVKGANAAHAACTTKCLGEGEKPVLVSDDKVFSVDNPEALKGHEGHYIKVKGNVDGDKVHVVQVAMLKQPKVKAAADSMSEMHK